MATKAKTKFLTIGQSSVVFGGWGKGNCWYTGKLSTNTAADFEHTFKCSNTGALKSTTGTLAF